MLVGLGQIVRREQARQQQQTRLSDLAKTVDQLANAPVEELGEIHQVLFLTVLTGDFVRLSVDDNGDLRHVNAPGWF